MTIWDHCEGKHSHGVRVGHCVKLPVEVDIKHFPNASIASVSGRVFSWLKRMDLTDPFRLTLKRANRDRSLLFTRKLWLDSHLKTL